MRWLKVGCLTIAGALAALVVVSILFPRLFAPPVERVRLDDGTELKVTDKRSFKNELGRRVFAVTYEARSPGALEPQAAALFARYRTEAEADQAEELTVVASPVAGQGAPARETESQMVTYFRDTDGRWRRSTSPGP